MSYPTAQTLQYGVTPAQESADARPHVPSFKHCNSTFPPHRNLTDWTCGARWRSGGIDSYRRAPKMLATCRPEKAARFVFAKISRCCDRANARMMAVSQTLK
jgi:hypothetical protein